MNSDLIEMIDDILETSELEKISFIERFLLTANSSEFTDYDTGNVFQTDSGHKSVHESSKKTEDFSRDFGSTFGSKNTSHNRSNCGAVFSSHF